MVNEECINAVIEVMKQYPMLSGVIVVYNNEDYVLSASDNTGDLMRMSILAECIKQTAETARTNGVRD